jgi:hypothetical protein
MLQGWGRRRRMLTAPRPAVALGAPRGSLARRPLPPPRRRCPPCTRLGGGLQHARAIARSGRARRIAVVAGAKRL